MDAPKVSVNALLPEDAKKPLDRNQVELVARGLLRPNAGMVQRLAIEHLKAMEALQTIEGGDFQCECEDHTSPDCCAKVIGRDPGFFCAHCFAGEAVGSWFAGRQ